MGRLHRRHGYLLPAGCYDEAALEQLIVFSNGECSNTLPIRQSLPQGERLVLLNKAAIEQLSSLFGGRRIRRLKSNSTKAGCVKTALFGTNPSFSVIMSGYSRTNFVRNHWLAGSAPILEPVWAVVYIYTKYQNRGIWTQK
jgi:hypothetical protein